MDYNKVFHKIIKLLEESKIEFKQFTDNPIIKNYLEIIYVDKKFMLFNHHWRYRTTIFETTNEYELLGFIKYKINYKEF